MDSSTNYASLLEASLRKKKKERPYDIKTYRDQPDPAARGLMDEQTFPATPDKKKRKRVQS